MIRNRKMRYFLEQCKHYAKKYGINEEDLVSEAWLRIKENERKINKRYIQLRIESVARDLYKSELKYKQLLERLRMVKLMEFDEWVEQEKKN